MDRLRNPDLAAVLLMLAALVVELVAHLQADATLLGQLPGWAPPALLGLAAAARLYLGQRRARLAADGEHQAVAAGLVAAGTGAAIGRAVALALTEDPGEAEEREADVDTDPGEVDP
jgi:hypothetical protein